MNFCALFEFLFEFRTESLSSKFTIAWGIFPFMLVDSGFGTEGSTYGGHKGTCKMFHYRVRRTWQHKYFQCFVQLGTYSNLKSRQNLENCQDVEMGIIRQNDNLHHFVELPTNLTSRQNLTNCRDTLVQIARTWRLTCWWWVYLWLYLRNNLILMNPTQLISTVRRCQHFCPQIPYRTCAWQFSTWTCSLP